MASPSPSSSSFSSSPLDETEWELVEHHSRPISSSGIFVNSRYIPFTGPADVTSVVPTVVSSFGGLVLSRGPWSAYHVTSPFACGPHLPFPRPNRAHKPDAPSVISHVGPIVVSAISESDGVYSFDVFANGRWRSSEQRLLVSKIDHYSGVAASGSAYFRAESVIIKYDFFEDSARILAPPPRTGEVPSHAWQLGTARGRLCCVVLTRTEIVVYALGGGGRWSEVAAMEMEGLRKAKAVRFESWGMEVMVVMEGRLLVVDLDKEMIVREMEIGEGTAASEIVHCVAMPVAGEEEDEDDFVEVEYA